ncbi:MAG: hypothetical protein Q4C83_03210, partial [Candidatus Saccharibacteria bacterium]|nr:hypothetical protein [Candidatus Saccharibacteria bacterium]
MTSKNFPPKTGSDNNEQAQAWQNFADVLREIKDQKEREEMSRAEKAKEVGAEAVAAAAAVDKGDDVPRNVKAPATKVDQKNDFADKPDNKATAEEDFLKYYHGLNDNDRSKVDKQARRHTMAETGVRGPKQLEELRKSSNADDRKLYQEYIDRLELNQEVYAEEMTAQRDLWGQAKRAAHLDSTKSMDQFTPDEQAKITAEFNRIRDTRERKDRDHLLADWLKAKDAREAERDKERLLEEWLYHKDQREKERYEEQLENGEHRSDDDSEREPTDNDVQPEVPVLHTHNDNSATNETTPPPAGESTLNNDQEQPVALVAIDIDRNAAIEEEAYAKARQRLTEELSKPEKGAGFMANVKNKVANMWKGNIFRGYYERKYQHEIADNLRADNEEMRAAINERALTPERIAELSQRYAAFNTMIRMGMDSEDAIHTSAGERRVKVDRESDQYKKTVEAIRKLAMGERGYTAEVFQEEMARIRGLEGDMDGRLDNYMATALYVKGQLEHLNASDNVNDRFNQL